MGTSFDAQKQFLNNLQDSLASPVDITGSIAQYQDVLKYARSSLN